MQQSQVVRSVGACHLVVDPPLAIQEHSVEVTDRAAAVWSGEPRLAGDQPLVPQVASTGPCQSKLAPSRLVASSVGCVVTPVW